jgi:hypothetical protein
MKAPGGEATGGQTLKGKQKMVRSLPFGGRCDISAGLRQQVVRRPRSGSKHQKIHDFARHARKQFVNISLIEAPRPGSINCGRHRADAARFMTNMVAAKAWL